MPVDSLADSIREMRPFLPAKDFAVSKSFYATLGFTVHDLGADLAEVRFGEKAFLLQNFYVEEWANNFMMHLLVTDVDGWWKHLSALDLPSRFAVAAPKAPKLEPWGLRVCYLIDPSGILWHIAETAG